MSNQISLPEIHFLRFPHTLVVDKDVLFRGHPVFCFPCAVLCAKQARRGRGREGKVERFHFRQADFAALYHMILALAHSAAPSFSASL